MVADDADVCFRTAQRWVSQYRKFGLVALARKSRDDRGARRVVSPKIKAAIEGLALERPPLPIRSICRQIRQFAEATGERLPHYGTVYDLVREVPGSLLTLAHHGSKAYSEGFDLVHRREAPRSDSLSRAYRIIVRKTKAEEPSGFLFAVTHVFGLFCNASAKYAQSDDPEFYDRFTRS